MHRAGEGLSLMIPAPGQTAPVPPSRSTWRHAVLPVAAAMLLPLAGQAAPAVASTPTPTDPAASTVVLGLLQLGAALGGAAELPPMSAKLPLTDVSVRDVLGLDTAVGRAVADAVRGKTYSSLGDLAGVVSASPALELTPTAAGPDGAPQWSLAIDITTSGPIPLRHEDERLRTGAGAATGELAARLTGTAIVRYDASALPLRQFSVVGNPALTVRAWTRAAGGAGATAEELTVPAFALVDGFVELSGQGSLTIDSSTGIELRDSNGRGGVTAEDLQFGSSEDLFRVTSSPAPNAVTASLALTTDLLASATGTVTIRQPATPPSAPYGTVRVNRGTSLDRMTSLTRPQAFGAFAQYASAVAAAERSVDAALPLLDGRLTDLYSPGNKLLDLVTRQAAARVVCGAAPSSPPSGAARPGQVRYCQALTDGVDATNVRWTAADGATLTGATSNDSVGTAPTGHVAVSGGGGFPRLTVSFDVGTAPNISRRTASTLLTSVQDLGRVLAEEGFTGAPSYDPVAEAFELPVAHAADRRNVDVRTGGASSLTPLTGLTGLCPADPSTAADRPRRCARPSDPDPSTTGRLNVGPSTFTGTLGIALPTAGSTASTAAAVAYVKPGTGGELWRVDDVAATVGSAKLSGRIGFLAVDVDVTGYTLTTTGTAARITLPVGTLALPSGAARAGVTPLNDLLGVGGNAPTASAVGTRGLSATASLAVRDGADSEGVRPLNRSGTITATYADLRDGVLPAVTTDPGYADLRRLDLRPSIRGIAATASAADVLHASAADGVDFVRDFGIDLAAPTTSTDPEPQSVERNVYDLDAVDGGLCTRFTVVSSTSLRCTDGPMSRPDPTKPPAIPFVPGHRFVIDGEPTALRDVLLDQLAEVLAVYSTPDATLGLDRTLPLLDVRPEEIDTARIALGDALGTLTAMAGDDDGRTSATSDGPEVSTLQGFGTAMKRQLPLGAVASLTLDSSKPLLRLVTDVAAADPAAQGQLRVATGNTLLRVVGAPGADGVPVGVLLPLAATSTARIELSIDLQAGTATVGRGTAVTEQVTGLRATDAAVKATLVGKSVEQGDVQSVVADAAVDVDIAVQVRTTPPTTADQWQPVEEFRDSLQSTRTNLRDVGCGSAAVTGAAACLKLSLAPVSATGTADIVTVSLRADDTSGGTGGAVKRPLAYRFLADPLPALSRTLRDALDGGITGDSLPFVGADLDGADDVPTSVSAFGAAARKALAQVVVADTATVGILTTALSTALNGVRVTGLSLKDPVVVSATCAAACSSTATVDDIRELRAPLVLQGGVTDKGFPFQAGPQGLPLKSDIEVPTSTTWSVPVTLGILRGTGPFLAMGKATTPVPVLTLSALEARVPDYSAANCHTWTRGKASSLYSARLPAAGSGRCLDALVGSLPSVLVDGDVTPTGGTATPRSGLDATVTVNVTPGAGTPDGPADTDGRVFLPALYDRLLPFDTVFGGTGSLDLYFEGFGAAELGFFDVLGTLDLQWTGTAGYTEDIAYENLTLDAKGVYDLLDVGYGQVKKALAPLDTVVDVLTAPVPGLSQVSTLTGGAPITLLDILAKLDPRVQLVVKLIEFQQLASNLPGSSGTELISLGTGLTGTFRLAVNAVQYNKCSATVASRASTASSALKVRASNTTSTGTQTGVKSVGLGSGGRCNGLPLTKAKAGFKKLKDRLTKKQPPKDPNAPRVGQDVKKRLTKSGYVSLPAISMPVLEDASQVMDLLLGQGDTTLLRVDLGKIGASATLMRAFGPFFAGPVPLMIQVSGTVALDGRVAVAFDTHGLTSRIEALDSPGDVKTLVAGERSTRGDVFAEGFYLEDVTAQGVDTPEIKLTFTASIAAGIFLTIFEAGVRGGVVLDLTLDAFDPNEDGKVRVNEFAGRGGGDCPFDVSSGIEFFLAVFLYIDMTVFMLDKSWDIVRSPRLPLFTFECPRTTPKLAVYSASAKTLTLTVGAYASQRGAFLDRTNEAYTVRSLGAATEATSNGAVGAAKTVGGVALQRVEVKGFDLTQTFDVTPDTTIVANAGGGSDTLRFIPGQKVTTVGTTSTVTAQPFTFTVDADGEAGNDKVITDAAADVVDGGDGNDVLETGAGNDLVDAGAGDDAVDAGEGQDTVSGGAGADKLIGGSGADVVRGDGGDDRLEGGLGADPGSLFASDTPAVIAPMLDGGDLLVGGGGSDIVTGGQGSDLVVGGEYGGDTPAVGDMTSVVDGMSAAGPMVTIRVTSPTLVLPTETAIRAECALAGTAESGDVDDVSGGPARDMVVGGGGADVLTGGGGSDLVCGRGGDDVVLGDGADVDAVDQLGDELLGGPGRDRLVGDGGNDALEGDEGPDQLRGGTGDDALDGGLGTDVLLGERGADSLTGDTATPATGQRSGREVVCRETTGVVSGLVDLNGDLVGNDLDDGSLDGLEVADGKVLGTSGGAYTGTLSGTTIRAGRPDLNGDGILGAADTGALADLAGVIGTTGEGDCLLGGDDDDVLAGGGGGDLLDGGLGTDTVNGGGDDDLARGGSGDDEVGGGAGNDLLVGDSGDDRISGQAGDDVLRGGAGDDLLRGGSDTAGAVDGEDELLGDRGVDVLTGGNSTLGRTSTGTSVVPGRTVVLLATASPDDDQLFGGFGADWVFGQSGNDVARSGHDDDVVEGGPGADRVQGDDGADLVIGGSSTAAAVDANRTGAGVPDGEDKVFGDGGPDGLDGTDVLAGDNALLERTTARPGPGSAWPGIAVVLYDETEGGAADELSGGGGRDLLLGQDGDDTLGGGLGDDALEGGDGADILSGGAGDDALTGDASSADGVIDEDRAPVGRLGWADALDGGEGDDVLAGDVARLVLRPGVQRADGTTKREVQLTDALASDRVSSDDELAGGAGRDLLLGQAGDDQLLGGPDDDVVEGGPGEDLLGGGGGADDLLGGSSSNTGALITGDTDRLLVPTGAARVVTALDASAAGVPDGRDVLYGDAVPVLVDEALDGPAGPDVLLGDNGRITRPGTTVAGRADRPVRIVAMADATAGGTSGNDVLDGQGGDDDLYGQLDDADAVARETVGATTTAVISVAGDLLRGGTGDDLLVGDQASAEQVAASELGRPITLRTKGDFVVEAIRAAGSLVARTTLTQVAVGGGDVLLGEAGDDAVHGGAGDDLGNGGAGDDVLYGGLGLDALWGGAAHDRIFGGQGDDALDLKVQAGSLTAWRAVAPVGDSDGLRSTANDMDTVNGGRGADMLQADVGDTGRTPGDRLLDWTGIHNLYAVCAGAYGAGKIQNKFDPTTADVLRELARSTGSVGLDEIALPGNGEETSPHPLAPGNFTCEA